MCCPWFDRLTMRLKTLDLILSLSKDEPVEALILSLSHDLILSLSKDEAKIPCFARGLREPTRFDGLKSGRRILHHSFGCA